MSGWVPIGDPNARSREATEVTWYRCFWVAPTQLTARGIIRKHLWGRRTPGRTRRCVIIPLPLLSCLIAKASLLVRLFNINNFCIQYEITKH